MKTNNLCKTLISKLSSLLPIILGCLLVWDIQCFQANIDFIFAWREILVISFLIIYLNIFLYCIFVRKNTSSSFYYKLIIVGSFVLKAFFIFMAPHNFSLHDLGEFQDLNTDAYSSGNLGYINYFFHNNHLPDFDPRDYWSFTNPPGYHYLAALVMKFTFKLKVKMELCYESIQIVNLFFAMLTIITINRILKEFDLDDFTVLLFTGFVAFFPFFTIFAATPTNDICCLFFMTLAVLYTIRWQKNQKLSYIIVIALAIGYAMFTKLNGAIVAFGTAFIFLSTMWKNRKNLSLYTKQFIVFGLICFPLGLFVPIYNNVKFGVPLFYINKLTHSFEQDISNVSILERLSLFPFKEMNFAFARINPERERNIWVQTVRTALFDEINPNIANCVIEKSALILLWLSVALFLTLTLLLFWNVTKNRQINLELRILILLTWLSANISYIQFCLNEKFVCTMSFRYVAIILVPLVVAGAISLCKWNRNRESLSKVNAISRAALVLVIIDIIILSVTFTVFLIGFVPYYFYLP